MLTKVLLHGSKKSPKAICSEMLQEAPELNDVSNLSQLISALQAGA